MFSVFSRQDTCSWEGKIRLELFALNFFSFKDGTYTLVQQLEQRRRDGVVVASVNDLDGENVESPDELPSLRQVGHARLQQDQHDHVHQVVQDLQGIEVSVQQHSFLPIVVSTQSSVIMKFTDFAMGGKKT